MTSSWRQGLLRTPQATWNALQSLITLHATMLLGLGAGAASSMTLTGTVAYVGNVCPGIRIRIDTSGTAGASGSASWSVDNGTNYTAIAGVIPTSFAIGATTVNFTGAYTAGDVHRAVVTRVTSLTGSKTCDQATVTKCPEFFVSLPVIGGRGLLAEGTLRGTELVCTDATVAGYGANANPLTVQWTGYTALPDSLQAFCAFAGTVSSNRTFRLGTTTTDQGSWHTDKVSNAGGAGATLNSYPSAALTSLNVCHVHTWRFTGTTAQHRVSRQPQLPVYDAVAPTGPEGGSGPYVPGNPTTTANFTLFARHDTGPDSFLDGGWHETSLWNTVLSDADMQRWTTDCVNRWAIPRLTGICIVDGDSLLRGFIAGGPPATPIATLLAPMMPGFVLTNEAVDGDTLLNMVNNIGANIIRKSQSGNPNQWVPFGTGTNDVRNDGANAGTVSGYIASYMSTLQKIGMIGIPCTIPACTDGTANGVFATINATTRATYGNRVADWAQALVDAGAVPGSAPYYSDGVHLTALGYQLCAAVTFAAIQRSAYPYT